MCACMLILGSLSASVVSCLLWRTGPDSLGGGAPVGPVLPVRWPLEKNRPPWYVTNDKKNSQIKVDAGAFVFPIRKGQIGSDSGEYFHANPNKVFPSDRVTMSYSVYFPPGFDWVKGGKLPGVCFGSTPDACSTGGDWGPTSGSFRIMFREGGAGIGYAYFSGANANAALGRQSAAVRAVAKRDGGRALWYDRNKNDLRFVAGRWNTVSFSIALNSPGAADGTLSLTVNGRTKTLRGISWRTAADVKFTSIVIIAFFGGGSSEWASKVDTEIRFKDIAVSA